MTDTEALIVHLNPMVEPLLISLAVDSPSGEPAAQIYFCIARLRILMRGVVSMLESESKDVREKGHEIINNLTRFTSEAEVAEFMKGWLDEQLD